jgi:hypothetical protein
VPPLLGHADPATAGRYAHLAARCLHRRSAVLDADPDPDDGDNFD